MIERVAGLGILVGRLLADADGVAGRLLGITRRRTVVLR